MPRSTTLLLLQGAAVFLSLASIVRAGASQPPHHHRPSSSWTLRTHPSSSTWLGTTGRRRSVVAFAVPRGGGGFDAEEIDDSSDIEEDSTMECADAEFDGDGEHDDGAEAEVEGDEDEEEEPADPILDLPEPSRFSFPTSSLSRPVSAVAHCASTVLRVTRRTCMAGARAVIAKGEEYEEGKPVAHTLPERVAHVFGEMYRAALTTPEEKHGNEEDGEATVEGEEKRKGRRKRRRRHGESGGGQGRRGRGKHRRRRTAAQCPTTMVCNGGGMEPSSSASNHAILQLAKRYNVDLPTNDKGQLSRRYTDSVLLSSRTTLNEALQKANADARFLMCYISKGGNKGNTRAVPNLLSSDVIKLANRRPLGKKQSGDSASYYIYITDDDKDVEPSMKRLKLKPPTSKKSKGKSSAAPILAIIYPASAVDSSGRIKATPRVLAQHHCHPPPSTPQMLGSWMSTLRKRHLKEYARLQHLRTEMALLRERTEGYVSSMKDDKVREETEEREAAKKEAEEEAERARKAALEERRARLLEALEEEPEAGADGVITIALRFAAGGKQDRRRFLACETYVNDVFDWIDAVHGMERERIELSTMNGAKRFRYVDEENSDDDEGESDEGEEKEEDLTLEEAGLGRMTALRVSEIVLESEEGDDEDGEEEDESEDEE